MNIYPNTSYLAKDILSTVGTGGATLDEAVDYLFYLFASGEYATELNKNKNNQDDLQRKLGSLRVSYDPFTGSSGTPLGH